MRGNDNTSQRMFSYVSLKSRIPDDHPLRPVRQMVDRVLAKMSDEFASIQQPNKRTMTEKINKTGLLIHFSTTWESTSQVMGIISKVGGFSPVITLGCFL